MPVKRRTFIQQSGLIGAGIMTLPSWAATTNNLSFVDPILEKKLDPRWIKSLYERGQPTTYLKSKNELDFIGMPVGGVTCGMLYLGGDGRLWLWDIFNKNQSGVVYKNIKWHEKIQFNFDFVRPFDGANYVEPVKDVRPLAQGYAVRIKLADRTITKRLQAEDWSEISFEATYPLATVRYSDPVVPVEISLKAYSPFIPLNEEDSSLPCTLLEFEFKNTTASSCEVSLITWLENKSAMYSANDPQYFRVNQVPANESFDAVTGSAHSFNWADEAFWNEHDYGNLCLFSLNKATKVNTAANVDTSDKFFDADYKQRSQVAFDQPAIGSVSNSISIAAGATGALHYGVSWYFPNLVFDKLRNEGKRHYANKFKSSVEVARYVADNFDRLSSQTKLWSDTWYKESTLPYWFLERTFLNTSTLATTTAHRFQSGRFWAWEGIGSCPGTCSHVWQYAHAMARIFPALERDMRERVDLGVAFHDDGHIGFRGEYDEQPAVDGQAGRILGVYREHQMSNNSEFLKRNWPRTKQAINFLLKQDTNGDGMTDTQLENTLDAKWPGEIAWIVGLSIAAIKAAELMAIEMDDPAMAQVCREYVTKGKANMEQQLFNGEYFIHRPDAVKGRTVIGSYNTCHIDQVYGQSWAYQVGLGRVLDQQKTLSALRALWKYNFTTDVGPYLKEHHGGRPYALPGEGGMIMNTNPKNETDPYGVKDAWQVTYFHECMSGFEHQVAAHMIAEGMIDEGLVVTRAIHDRYHAAKRNPFNEVECSDHYARAMASYGTFITACGFTCHGPKGQVGFAPRIGAENFKAPFTSPEGWGTYAQTISNKPEFSINLKYGVLNVQELNLPIPARTKNVTVLLNDKPVAATLRRNGTSATVVLNSRIAINAGEKLVVKG